VLNVTDLDGASLRRGPPAETELTRWPADLAVDQFAGAAAIRSSQITQRVQRPRVVSHSRHALEPFRFPQQALGILDHNWLLPRGPTQRNSKGSNRNGDTDV
jgi:hypothetical protein